MRNVLAFIGAATITFLVVGWYLGWYQISNLSSPNGRQNLQVDINPGKITDDVKKGVEMVDRLREKAKPTEAKPAPGPASSFFAPTPADNKSDSPGGWKPIGSGPAPGEDPGAFGIRVPRN